MRTICKRVETLFNKFSEKHFLKQLTPLSEVTKVITSDTSGRGVVASSNIPAGALLGIYPGTHISYKEFLEKEQFVSRSVKSAYMLSKDIIIDPTDMFGYLTDTPDHRIALINEASPEQQTNIVAINTKRNVWYISIQDIKAGEELFTNYGPQYKRNYSSSDVGNLTFSKDQIKILHEVSKRYSWTRKGIKELIEEK